MTFGAVMCVANDDRYGTQGTTFVIKPGPKCAIVAQNRLEERCSASPAVAHGQLFLRTLEHLYCIEGGERAQ